MKRLRKKPLRSLFAKNEKVKEPIRQKRKKLPDGFLAF